MSPKPCDFAHVLGYARAAAPTAPPPPASDDDDKATAEQYAAIEFEPLERDPSILPSNTQWAALADPHLVTLRLGLAVTWQTKPELIESCAREPEAFMALAEALNRTEKVLNGFVELAAAAKCRLFVALTVVNLREQAEGSL